MSAPIYSLGHSNLTLKKFIDLLRQVDIDIVVDIRRYPDAEVYSDFKKENLEGTLERSGMEYIWKGDILGGYRGETLRDESPNKAWEATGFRTYADHALSDEFQRELDELIKLSESKIVGIMCAESIYWKCYRRILCDWLVARDKTVIHLRRGETKEHEMSSRADVTDGKVTYPENM